MTRLINSHSNKGTCCSVYVQLRKPFLILQQQTRPFTIGWWCWRTCWIWVTPGLWIGGFTAFGFWRWRVPPEPSEKWWWSFASLRPRVRNLVGIWCWRCYTQTSKQSTTSSGDYVLGENSLHSCSSSLTWNWKQHHPKDVQGSQHTPIQDAGLRPNIRSLGSSWITRHQPSGLA